MSHHHKPTVLGWLLESFWIADALVLAMLAFFIVVGGGSSAPVAIVGSIMAVLYAAHAVRRHQRQRVSELSPEARRIRERRGF
jgi:membrane associated rhomboid family serine protease